MKRILAAAAILLSATSARAEEIYITGFGHIFSLGVCAVGPGRCISYLFVDGEIERVCANPAGSPLKVAGHSMGAGAAIRLVNGAHACGRKVSAAAFLDSPMHPREFGIPRGIRTLTLYSPGFYGAGEGHADAERYSGGHIMQAFDSSVRDRVRRLFDGRQ